MFSPPVTPHTSRLRLCEPPSLPPPHPHSPILYSRRSLRLAALPSSTKPPKALPSVDGNYCKRLVSYPLGFGERRNDRLPELMWPSMRRRSTTRARTRSLLAPLMGTRSFASRVPVRVVVASGANRGALRVHSLSIIAQTSSAPEDAFSVYFLTGESVHLPAMRRNQLSDADVCEAAAMPQTKAAGVLSSRCPNTDSFIFPTWDSLFNSIRILLPLLPPILARNLDDATTTVLLHKINPRRPSSTHI